MTMIRRPQFLYSPVVTSFLPALYVAWADKVLSPSEIKLLRQQIIQLDELSEGDKAQLLGMSNPLLPPAETETKSWLEAIQHHLEHHQASNLVELGMQMAQTTATFNGETYIVSPDVHHAITTLQNMLPYLDRKALLNYKPSEKLPLPTEFVNIHEWMYAKKPLREKVFTLLNDSFFHNRYDGNKDSYRELTLQWVKKIADQGLGALAYPKYAGGKESVSDYADVFEALSAWNMSASIKYGVQFGLFGMSIQLLGNENQHKKYLKKIGRLELPGCFAMTETGHGSNVRGLETTATYDKSTNEFVIHSPTYTSGKEYIGNAFHGQLATVFAQLIVDGHSHGVHAILVPLRNAGGHLLPGISWKDNGYKLGLNGIDNGRLWFDHVRVPRENLLDKFGTIDASGAYISSIKNPDKRFFTMLGTLVGGRVCVPRGAVAATQTALTSAVRYAALRRQFGPEVTGTETVLLDYPSHQRRLIPAVAHTFAYQIALDNLTASFIEAQQNGDLRKIETLAAGLKARITAFTTDTIQECREACGGKGYLWENRFADLKADTDIFTTFEGDNTVLLQLVAKGVLTNFQKEFGNDNVFGVLRLLLGQLSTAISEQNPLVVRNVDKSHLYDPDFHLSAFAYRTQKLLVSVSQRIVNRIRSGQSSYQAYLSCQDHLLALARAFVDEYVLKQFQSAVRRFEDQKSKPYLVRLVNLYALYNIEADKGFFLESGYISSGKSKAIRRLVNDLCLEIRPDVVHLVGAWGIPEYLLAPIALGKM